MTQFDPVNGQTKLEMHNSLTKIERCKKLSEVPAAIEHWDEKLKKYSIRTGKTSMARRSATSW